MKVTLCLWTILIFIIAFLCFTTLYFFNIEDMTMRKVDLDFLGCSSRLSCQKYIYEVLTPLQNGVNKSSVTSSLMPVQFNSSPPPPPSDSYKEFPFEKTFSIKKKSKNIKNNASFPEILVEKDTYVSLKLMINDAEQFTRPSNSTIASRLLSRKKHLNKECYKKNYNYPILNVKKEKLDHILVDEKNKILFCYIPKVACTNWKRVLYLMTGKSQNISYVNKLPAHILHKKNLFPSLQNYSIPDIHRILHNYKKFFFVRHPFERLLSAYKNKLEQSYNSSKYFQSRFGKIIVKKFRANASENSLAKGDDVTFSEFVNYLVSINKNKYNEHWQTMVDLCFPCFINYDYIGKYEYLLEESKYILNELGFLLPFPPISKPSTTASILYQYLSQLPKQLYIQLKTIYLSDLLLFNYDAS